jgi:hypothetical protein
MRPCLILALGLLVGCSSAANFTSAPLDRQSGETAYRIDERPGGLTIYLRRSTYRFVPQPGQTQAECRQEAIALGTIEARRRGFMAASIDERLTRTSFGRDGVTGTSTCTATAEIDFVARPSSAPVPIR